MKVQFKALSSNSPSLFPEDIFSKTPENHPVRLVNEVVDKLDIGQLIKQYKGGGTTSLHPRMMIKVLFYAYLNNIYSVWFYVKASQNIKRDTYKKTLRKISYGNNVLNQEDVDFWNYGDFTISAKNQVEFLIKLYENKLPFSQREGKDLGWWLGYLETKENVFFFATRLTKDILTSCVDGWK